MGDKGNIVGRPLCCTPSMMQCWGRLQINVKVRSLPGPCDPVRNDIVIEMNPGTARLIVERRPDPTVRSVGTQGDVTALSKILAPRNFPSEGRGNAPRDTQPSKPRWTPELEEEEHPVECFMHGHPRWFTSEPRIDANTRVPAVMTAGDA